MASRPRQLRPLHSHEAPKTLVVVVSGIGTDNTATWFEGQIQPWDSFLPDDVLPSPSFYQYDHGLRPADLDARHLWGNILERGLDLLERLLMIINENEKLQHCAILFIGYSLGGIIVKQCLTQILERPHDFRALVAALAGFIAIATPHSRLSEPKTWDQPFLLTGTTGYHRRGQQTSTHDASRLASLCSRFESSVTNLHILTLCETEPTGIKSFFVRAARSSKEMIVPKEACILQSRLEEFHEIASNHLNICDLTPSKLLEEQVRKAVSSSLARIQLNEGQTSSTFSRLHESAMVEYENSLRDFPVDNDAADMTYGRHYSNDATVAISTYQREGLATLSNFASAKNDPILPCHIILNPRNRDFHGRDDILAEIESVLSPFDDDGNVRREVKTLAICGPGGFGKTQVANEFAHSHVDMYDAIFWVNAAEATTLADEYSRIAETLGLVLEGTADAHDLVVTRELVKGWLAKPLRSYSKSLSISGEEDEVPWLLIFDNVDDPDIIADYLPPMEGSSGSILLTSRDSLAKTPFYQIRHGIDLLALGFKEASELLLKLTWRAENPEEEKLSVVVAEILGGMPLALIQMAGLMVRQSLSFADFLKRYEEEEAHGSLFQLSLEPGHKRTKYGFTLASVWALEKLKHSSGLLDIMALLDPDGIPEAFLEGASNHLNYLEDYPKSVTAYQDARSELLRSSLISRDRTKSKLTIHRLIQDCARTKMDPDRWAKVFSAAVDVLWMAWPPAAKGVRGQVARWKDCELVSPHLVRMKDRYVRAGKAYKAKVADNLRFATLLNELGWYFIERGHISEPLPYLQLSHENVKNIVEDHKRRDQDDDDDDRATAVSLLAETYRNLGGLEFELNNGDEALRNYLIFNSILVDENRGKEVVPNARLTGSCIDVGLSFLMKNDLEQATVWLENAIKEAGRLQEPNKIMEAQSLALINLGVIFWLQHRYEDAAEILETARKEREELFGPNDRQSMITGRALFSLGNVRRSQGFLDQSLERHEQALLHFKETVGNFHHRTGNASFKVAEHYLKNGELQRAGALLDHALKVFSRHACHAGEKGRVLFLRSIVYQEQGNTDSASADLKEARSIYKTLSKKMQANEEPDIGLEDFDEYVHVWGR